MKKKQPEVIRVAQRDYNLMVKKARAIQKLADDRASLRTAVKFTGRNRFPTVEQLEEHDVANHMRSFLPFLVYYREPQVFYSDDSEFERTREYLNNLFDLCVDIVEDEDMDPINSVTPFVWEKYTDDEKRALFRPLIGYYGNDEFDSFVKDLGFKRFMGAYGLKKKDCKNGVHNQKLRSHLKKIWDFVQEEPLEV